MLGYDLNFEKVQKKMLRRTAPDTLFPVQAYDEASKLYFLEDSAIGYIFICEPLAGADEGTVQQLQVLMKERYPKDTIVSVSLWAGPDVKDQMDGMEYIRKQATHFYHGEPHEKAARLVADRKDFIEAGTKRPIDEYTSGIVRNVKVLFTVKIPTKAHRAKEPEIEMAVKLRRTTEQTLRTIGFCPEAPEPEEYLRLMGTILNWSENPSWKRDLPIYDDQNLINTQIIERDTAIQREKGKTTVGKKIVSSLSVKKYPEYPHLLSNVLLLGDVKDGMRGVNENILITLNIHFPDAEEAKTKFEVKKNAVTWQAMGPMQRYVPKLKLQKNSVDAMGEALTTGDRIVSAYLSFHLFTDTDEEAISATSNLKTYYSQLGYDIHEDVYTGLPMFLHALPFCASNKKEIRDMLVRYRTMGAQTHAIHLMPVLSEWKGGRSPVITLSSRNNQLMCLDIFDSDSNYNTIVAAESGAGKSFFVNNMITQYLSLGADIWIIEIGRSYKKQTITLGGEHMEFDSNSDISLNPFTAIVDFNDQASMLMAVLLAMIFDNDRPSDFQSTALQRIVAELWAEKGNDLNIDTLEERLLNYKDEGGEVDTRITDMGSQIYQFTSKGDLGKWFNRPATINFSNPLTVLELEELQGHKTLQKVVLLQLISTIQRSMFLGSKERKKILIIEEAWDLISGENEGSFIEAGVRKLRKYNGATVIILQSMGDLYKTAVGETIVENSANKFYLKQRGATIDRLHEEKKLDLTDGQAELLKTVHTIPGRYSELFVSTSRGKGIARFYASRKTQLLFTTDPNETALIEQNIALGMTTEEAIDSIIYSEGLTVEANYGTGG
jgi:conjugal transfer ATP-binding protein TraC